MFTEGRLIFSFACSRVTQISYDLTQNCLCLEYLNVQIHPHEIFDLDIIYQIGFRVYEYIILNFCYSRSYLSYGILLLLPVHDLTYNFSPQYLFIILLLHFVTICYTLLHFVTLINSLLSQVIIIKG
ncbi:unnamed protein product [Meganyctiphanes norvegica]|uniref:Uncharacterized protein n=1 Tax=Meganyctiphanes norvegica TaxID=48144 RepID=A0AAV2RJY1_MEGNR